MLQHSVRRGAGLALAFGAVLSAATAPSAGADAVSYQQDAAHTGLAAGATLTPPLGKRWVRTDLGEGLGYPLLAENRIFVSASGFSGGRSVYALDRRTGAILWSRPMVSPTLAYASGRLFTVSDGIVQALSASTGATLWTVQ